MKFTSIKLVSAALLSATLSLPVMAAEPVMLSDSQMDNVTAGRWFKKSNRQRNDSDVDIKINNRQKAEATALANTCAGSIAVCVGKASKGGEVEFESEANAYATNTFTIRDFNVKVYQENEID